MGLGLPDGGHLTHGYYTAKKKMTASSIYFQSFPYGLAPETNLIDYDALAAQAKIFKPRLIICGASAYPRDWDYAALKKTAEKEGAWLMADIAHTSGLVAAQELNNPFEYCDVVTTTTHKTLRGPRAGLIFFRKDLANAADLEKRVNDAVFPACQGGPHNNTIAGIATALLQVAQPSFKVYAKQVIKNAQTLAETLVAHGYKLQTGGTDNHLVLWDLRPIGLTGSKVEKVCDLMGITINSGCLPPISVFLSNASIPRKRRLGRRLCTGARRHPPRHVGDHVPRHARGRRQGRRGLPAPCRAALAAAAEGGGQQDAQGLRARCDVARGGQGWLREGPRAAR
ncbi:serine hydroxymethyltransferase-domain-containing protein [Mycena sp. CBHHK59/15]|nr:serine hydroxymethyltransferase-domain-containing protein [Mycena sp. CBHHK59/15]